VLHERQKQFCMALLEEVFKLVKVFAAFALCDLLRHLHR
jgi:hypothetical protein